MKSPGENQEVSDNPITNPKDVVRQHVPYMTSEEASPNLIRARVPGGFVKGPVKHCDFEKVCPVKNKLVLFIVMMSVVNFAFDGSEPLLSLLRSLSV